VETGGDHGMEGVKGSGNRRDNHRDKLLSVPRSLPPKCGCSTSRQHFIPRMKAKGFLALFL